MTLSGALCPPIFYFLNTTPVELHISCDAKHATRVLCGSAAASRLCELHRDFVCLLSSNQILALHRSSSGHQRCLHVHLQEFSTRSPQNGKEWLRNSKSRRSTPKWTSRRTLVIDDNLSLRFWTTTRAFGFWIWYFYSCPSEQDTSDVLTVTPYVNLVELSLTICNFRTSFSAAIYHLAN